MQWKLWQSLGAIPWQCQQVTSGHTDSTTNCAAWTGYPRTWHCWCGQCFCGNAWCLTKTKFYMAQWAIGSYDIIWISKLLKKKHKRINHHTMRHPSFKTLEEWPRLAASHQPCHQQYGTSLRHTFLGSLMAVLVPSLAKTARFFFTTFKFANYTPWGRIPWYI